MRLLTTYILLVSLAFVGLVRAECSGWTTADPWDTSRTALTWNFGSNEGGGSNLYNWGLYNDWWTSADLYTQYNDAALLYETVPMINQAPIVGGKNMTNYYGTVEGFIPTANFTCLSDTSGMWGPSYADYRERDGEVRSSHPNLEVYTHFSAPTESSYIRTIYFIKNTGATPDRVSLLSLTYTTLYTTDISPAENIGRYYTGYYYEPNDLGAGSDPGFYYPGSIHARGQKSLDKTAIAYSNANDFTINTIYTTVLGAGEEFAFMHIMSMGYNTSAALKNAAEIDAEPEYIFHNLTSDQLSLIRNWGGCQVIIGPTATVTVTPPAQCSSGLTSDFTVQASSTRDDLTTDFTHRVVGIQNVELVAAQSSTTLSVPNGAGAVRHQLWYKQCLVIETEFNACARS